MTRGSRLGALSPRAWDRRLVAPGPLWRLRLLHLTLLVAIGLRLAMRAWWSVAERSAESFEPVPVLSWLEGPPGSVTVLVVWLAGLAAVAIGLVAVRTRRSARPALVAAWVALLVLAGLWGSAGKVLHNDVLLLTVTVPVLLAPSARPWRQHEVRWGWPPRAALTALGVVYFLTGYQKLRHSGLDWALGENMRWILLQGHPKVATDLVRGLAGQLWLTQLMAGGALLLELTAPLLLAVRRTRLWFALAVTALHGSIWLLVGIDYSAWVLAAWAVVVPSLRWERVARREVAVDVVEPEPSLMGAP